MITRDKIMEACNQTFQTWKDQVAAILVNLEQNIIEAAKQGKHKYVAIEIPEELKNYSIIRDYTRKELRKVVASDITIFEEGNRFNIYW